MSERPGRGEPADAPACGETRPALKKRGSDDKLEEAFVRLSGVIRTRPAGRGCLAAPERLRRRRSGTSGMARQSGSCRIGSWVSSAGRRRASPTPRTGTWKCRRVENPARPACARPLRRRLRRHTVKHGLRARMAGPGATGNGPARPTRTAAVSRSRRISTSAVGRASPAGSRRSWSCRLHRGRASDAEPTGFRSRSPAQGPGHVATPT